MDNSWSLCAQEKKRDFFIPGALPIFKLNENMSNYHIEMSDNYMGGGLKKTNSRIYNKTAFLW
jgi:hypothetical protein